MFYFSVDNASAKKLVLWWCFGLLTCNDVFLRSSICRFWKKKYKALCCSILTCYELGTTPKQCIFLRKTTPSYTQSTAHKILINNTQIKCSKTVDIAHTTQKRKILLHNISILSYTRCLRVVNECLRLRVLRTRLYVSEVLTWYMALPDTVNNSKCSYKYPQSKTPQIYSSNFAITYNQTGKFADVLCE